MAVLVHTGIGKRNTCLDPKTSNKSSDSFFSGCQIGNTSLFFRTTFPGIQGMNSGHQMVT